MCEPVTIKSIEAVGQSTLLVATFRFINAGTSVEEILVDVEETDTCAEGIDIDAKENVDGVEKILLVQRKLSLEQRKL